jgi:hypothetical protein
LELAQFWKRVGSPEAIEFLAVDMEEESNVVPALDSAEDGIQFDCGDQAIQARRGCGEHGTHVAENGSENQSLEGGAYAPSLRLRLHTARPPGSCALVDWRTLDLPIPGGERLRPSIDEIPLEPVSTIHATEKVSGKGIKNA